MPNELIYGGVTPTAYQISTVKNPGSVSRRAEAFCRGGLADESVESEDGAVAFRLKGVELPIYVYWNEDNPLLLAVYTADGVSREWITLLTQKLANYNLQHEYIPGATFAKPKPLQAIAEDGVRAFYWRTILHIRETYDGATQAVPAGGKVRHCLFSAVRNMETFLGSNPTPEDCRLFLTHADTMIDRSLELLKTIDLKAKEQ